MSARTRRTPRSSTGGGPPSSSAVADLRRANAALFCAVHRQGSCVTLQHVTRVTATDERSPQLGARPADAEWEGLAQAPPAFPQPIGRELYRGAGADVAEVLAAADPPPTIGVCMLAVEPAELVFRCRTAKAAVALASAVKAHAGGRLDASMRECPAGGFPLCVVAASAAAAQLRLTVPVAAFGRWLVTPEFLRFALAAAADQMAHEEEMLVAAATSVHAVMPAVVAEHTPTSQRSGAGRPGSARAAPLSTAAKGRGTRNGGAATSGGKQARSGRSSGKKMAAAAAAAAPVSVGARRTSTSSIPSASVPRDERTPQAGPTSCRATPAGSASPHDDSTQPSFLAAAADQREGRPLAQCENAVVGRMGAIEIAAGHSAAIALIALVQIDDQPLAHGSVIP